MLPVVVKKPYMSAAQVRAFEAMLAVNSGEVDAIERFRDTRTVATLIAMAKRYQVEIVKIKEGRTWRIHSAIPTKAGQLDYEREIERQAAIVERERKLDKMLGRKPVLTPQGPLAADDAATAPPASADRELRAFLGATF